MKWTDGNSVFIHGQRKSLRAGQGHRSGRVWGSNGWPQTFQLVMFSGSDMDGFWPPIGPGWYLQGTWVTIQGVTHTTVWGDGQALTAMLTLSAIENNPADPMLPAAIHFTRGNVGAFAWVLSVHGTGSSK